MGCSLIDNPLLGYPHSGKPSNEYQSDTLRYPLVNSQFANLKMAMEIVDLPMKNGAFLWLLLVCSWCSTLPGLQPEDAHLATFECSQFQRRPLKTGGIFGISIFKQSNIPSQWLVGGLEHFLCSHILGKIIPIDFHIFQRGGLTTNQNVLDGKIYTWRIYHCP